MARKRLSLTVFTTFALLSLLFFTQAASAGEAPALTKASKPWKMAFVVSIYGLPYFSRAEQGLKEFAPDFGVDAYMTGPTEFDSAAQMKIIEDLISKDTNSIAMIPIDPASAVPMFKKAKGKGMTTIAWAATLQDESVIDWQVSWVDDAAYSRHLWDTLVKYMGDSGDYAILTGGLASPLHNSWIDPGLEYSKTKYPNLKLVTDRIPDEEKQDVAYQKTLELIKAYPNLKGIIAIASPSPIGAAQAVREKGLQDKIAVVGTGMPLQAKPYLMDGSLKSSPLWDPKIATYSTAYITLLAIEKQPIYDGLQVPKTGSKIQVKGKHIVPGPWIDFTKENVDQYPF